MKRTLVRGFVLASIGIGASIACSPIEGTPLSQGPMNICPDFPCKEYKPPRGSTGFANPECNAGRCEASVGMPDYATAVVVDVPDTSFYAPGRTFVMTREEVKDATTTGSRLCVPPRCVQLPVLVQGTGHYRLTSKAAKDVAFPQVVPDGTPIPYRVAFERLFGPSDAASLGLPVDTLFTTTRVERRPAQTDVSYSNSVAVGRYRRVAYPQPPYDAYFPPIEATLPVDGSFIDDLLLGDEKSPLDDPTGDFRTAKIKRADGLDGFRVWLEDEASHRRISTIRPLTGAATVVRLDTVNQKDPNGSTPAIREDVQIVVVPRESALGVPKLTVPLFLASTSLGEIEYPQLPDPVVASGVVAVPAGGNALNGVPSRITFTSNGLLQKDATLGRYLSYEASVSTDGSGRFATVLPPGVYYVTIEPAEGTGRAKVVVAEPLDLSFPRTDLQFRPVQLRTRVQGVVRLTDARSTGGVGRAVADAEVRALPGPKQTEHGTVARPGHARTDVEGRFTMDLDPGLYDIVVDPQLGTGFPRVITPTIVSATPVQLETIEVPPPVRVSITFRDPNATLAGNPIVRAMVRVFGPRVTNPSGPLVELGRAMTNESGNCEILLAQQPQ